MTTTRTGTLQGECIVITELSGDWDFNVEFPDLDNQVLLESVLVISGESFGDRVIIEDKGGDGPPIFDTGAFQDAAAGKTKEFGGDGLTCSPRITFANCIVSAGHTIFLYLKGAGRDAVKRYGS